MKKLVPKLQKLRNRIHTDEIYYTYSNWESRDLNGEEFIQVIRELKEDATKYYVRKESMEYIK